MPRDRLAIGLEFRVYAVRVSRTRLALSLDSGAYCARAVWRNCKTGSGQYALHHRFSENLDDSWGLHPFEQ